MVMRLTSTSTRMPRLEFSTYFCSERLEEECEPWTTNTTHLCFGKAMHRAFGESTELNL